MSVDVCPKCDAPIIRAATPEREGVVRVCAEPCEDGDLILLRGRRYPLAVPVNRLDPRNEGEYQRRFLRQMPLLFKLHPPNCKSVISQKPRRPRDSKKGKR
jgi:hypothetical protein